MRSGIGEFIEDLRQQQKLPDVLAERCVHSIIETANCRACVAACPKSAWLLDDEALRLNQAACDGCGLCVPACPQGAITRPRALPFSPRISPLDHQAQSTVFLACENAGVPKGADLLPCVHAIGLSDLLHLLRQGIRQLCIATGDCDLCCRGKAPRLQQQLQPLNRSLARSGLVGLIITHCAAESWQRQLEASTQAASGAQLSRRGFLRRFSYAGLQEGLQLTGLADPATSPYQAPGQLFPADNAATQWPCSPQIDAHRCIGCDACARLCPQQAIRLTVDPPAYAIEARRCNGCAICVDVCERQAVTLTRWQAQQQQTVTLHNRRCRACGVNYHLPTDAKQPTHAYCQICARHNHHHKLFQVLN